MRKRNSLETMDKRVVPRNRIKNKRKNMAHYRKIALYFSNIYTAIPMSVPILVGGGAVMYMHKRYEYLLEDMHIYWKIEGSL